MYTNKTMGQRIKEARQPDSQPEVAAKFALRGVVITPAAVSKWEKNHEMPESKVAMFCDIYGVNAAWLRYGIGPKHSTDQRHEIAAAVVGTLPDPVLQQTMTYVEFLLQSAPAKLFEAQEPLANYFRMIDKFNGDMQNRKNQDKDKS